MAGKPSPPTLLEEARALKPFRNSPWLDRVRAEHPELVPQLCELRRAIQAKEITVSVKALVGLLRARGIGTNRTRLGLWLKETDDGQE